MPRLNNPESSPPKETVRAETLQNGLTDQQPQIQKLTIKDPVKSVQRLKFSQSQKILFKVLSSLCTAALIRILSQ